MCRCRYRRTSAIDADGVAYCFICGGYLELPRRQCAEDDRELLEAIYGNGIRRETRWQLDDEGVKAREDRELRTRRRTVGLGKEPRRCSECGGWIRKGKRKSADGDRCDACDAGSTV